MKENCLEKYDEFILGPIKQLNAILENHLLGRVFTSNKILKFLFNDGPVIILKHHGRCFFSKGGEYVMGTSCIQLGGHF